MATAKKITDEKIQGYLRNIEDAKRFRGDTVPVSWSDLEALIQCWENEGGAVRTERVPGHPER